MLKYFLLIIFVVTIASNIFSQSSFSIENKGKKYTVTQLSSRIGQLNNTTFVKLVCIKPGMIGMPNISDSSYRGKYTNSQGETCYTFVLEPDGFVTIEDQVIAVFKVDNEAFLIDGTKVHVECLAPSAVAKIQTTQGFYGTYYKNDPSGDANKRQQCNVYIQKIRKPMPYISGIADIGKGFR